LSNIRGKISKHYTLLFDQFMALNETQLSVDSLFWKIALKDDEEAFRLLFYNFFPPLCVFAARYIPDKETCEDIVQEVFLKIWKNRKRLEINTSARNFLVTAVKNSCIDHQRKRDTEENYRTYQSLLNHQMMTSDDIYTIRELEEMIHESLNKLPDNIRLVFEMNRFEGKTYSEIASQLNISVKTVEAYMSKALKILRVELKDYLPFVILFLW